MDELVSVFITANTLGFLTHRLVCAGDTVELGIGYDFEHCCFHDPDIPMRYVIFSRHGLPGTSPVHIIGRSEELELSNLPIDH